MSVKISALPAAGAAAGADQHPVNQAGTTKRLTNSQIATFIETALTQLSINGGNAFIAPNGDTSLAQGTASFSINGAALFANGFVTISPTGTIIINAAISLVSDGSAQFANNQATISAAGALFADEKISTNNGFSDAGLDGITGDFVILVAGVPKTFHFQGGILTSVT
jgi:hypothetical protein